MTSKRRGRPKGARNEATIVREVGRMPTTITQGEEKMQVTIAEAMVRLLERRTMTGDVPADRLLAKLRARIAPRDEDEKPAILLVPEPLDQDEWIRRAEICNQFTEQPGMPEPPPGSTLEGPPAHRSSRSGQSLRLGPSSNPPRTNLRGRLIR